MYEKFTDRSRKCMQLANLEAQRYNHEYVGTEHLLLGLIKEGSGVAANVIKNLDRGLGELHDARREVEKVIQVGPVQTTSGKLPMAPRLLNVLDLARAAADELNHTYVGTEHLLLGLAREPEGAVAQVFKNVGATREEIEAEILALLGLAPEDADPGPDYRQICFNIKMILNTPSDDILARIAEQLHDIPFRKET